jgi:FkbM family methyltransferase
MVKEFINSLIPPIFKKGLTHFQSKFQNKPNPEWIKFRDGVLKDLVFLIDPRSNLGKIYINGHDHFIYAHLDKHKTSENPVFYDIGSHFGYHTLGFSKIAGKNGKVYAFEPNPLNKKRLEKNINANPTLCMNIFVKDTALTDYKGTAQFEMITELESGWSSNSHLITTNTIDKSTDVKKHIIVDVDSIDNLIREGKIEKPDFIKIDVEGGEYRVINGSIETIKKYKPIFFIEIHTIECMFLIQQFLSELKYSLELIDTESDGRCFIKAYSNEHI